MMTWGEFLWLYFWVFGANKKFLLAFRVIFVTLNTFESFLIKGRKSSRLLIIFHSFSLPLTFSSFGSFLPEKA